jgi:hypothetical protein
MSEANVGPTRRSAAGTPRWVKMLGIILIILVLLFVTLHLAGIHNPGMDHMSGMPTMQQSAGQP